MKLPKSEISSINKYIPLSQHLREAGINLAKEEYETLEKFLIVIHQAKHPTTFYQSSRKKVSAIFERNWLCQFTPLLTKDCTHLSEYAIEYLHLDTEMSGRLNGAFRSTFDEWEKETSCASGYNSSPNEVKTGLEKAQKALGIPRYHRVIICKETGDIEQAAEYPGWLLDSIDFTLAA